MNKRKRDGIRQKRALPKADQANIAVYPNTHFAKEVHAQ